MPASSYARFEAIRAVWKYEPSQELCWLSRPFDSDSCSAFTVMMSVLPIDRAISGVVTIAQAAPSDTPQQSNNPSGSAIIGALRHISSVMALRRCAFGFLAPLAWLLTETWAMARFNSSLEAPCLVG